MRHQRSSGAIDMRTLAFVLVVLLLAAPVATAATYTGRAVVGTGLGTYFGCIFVPFCEVLRANGYDTVSLQWFHIGPVGGHAYQARIWSLSSQPEEDHTTALAEICFYDSDYNRIDCDAVFGTQTAADGLRGPTGWRAGVVPAGATIAMVGSCVGADIRYEIVIE